MDNSVKYNQIVSKFEVKQAIVDKLAKKINKKFWGENKDLILNGKI